MTTLRRWLSDGVRLWAVGGGFLLWHLWHLAVHPEGHTEALMAVFGVFGPIGASVTVLAVGAALGLRWGPSSLPRVGRWVVVGTVAAAVLGVLTLLYFRANGVVLPERVHFVFNVATGGALGGTVVGVYDARASRIHDRLRNERHRAGLLNQRLHVVNRVLRHDLRNDVNVIHGYASLLADDADPAVAERGAIIRERADELASLSERARDLQRLIEDQRVDPETDLAEVVSRRLDAFREEHPDAQVRVDVPDRAPVGPVPLVGVVVDLLAENAVVHNDRDEPMVSVGVSTFDDYVRLRIADDGPGIPEAERAVFESGTETPLRHSEGLGLWVVEWAVAEAGGRLDLRDRSVGTVVTVTLPRVDPEATDSADSILDALGSPRFDGSVESVRGGTE